MELRGVYKGIPQIACNLLKALKMSVAGNAKIKKSREGGLSALEGDLRKALGRSFLRWEKDNVKGTKASV